MKSNQLATNPLKPAPVTGAAVSGEGGPPGRSGLAWAVFEQARNPYYILIVIYIFAPYFTRDIIGAGLLASGALDGMDPDKATATANAGGQANIASVTKWAGLSDLTYLASTSIVGIAATASIPSTRAMLVTLVPAGAKR